MHRVDKLNDDHPFEKYYEIVLRDPKSIEFYILDPFNDGSLSTLNRLAEIAIADYPELDPEEIIAEGIIGRYPKKPYDPNDDEYNIIVNPTEKDYRDWGEINRYAISFIINGVEPRDDYKPLSDLFPLGFTYFD